MTAGVKWTIQQKNGEHCIAIMGEINEEAEFAPLLQQRMQRARLDLNQVGRINSIGVQKWIDLVDALHGRGTKIILEKCSPTIVRHLNLVANFGGIGAEVRSIYAPYFCSYCDVEHHELIDLQRGGVPQVAETLKCPTCGREMHFDDVPESYFEFLANEQHA